MIESKEEPAWWDESVLRRLYIDDDLSMKEVANELGCTDGTICNSLRTFGISKPQFDGAWQNEDVLKNLYIEEEMTPKEIAEELDCHHNTITQWLQRTGIVDESQTDPWKDKETVAEVYYTNTSQREMADELGCSRSNVSYWVTKLGIENIRDDVEFDSYDKFQFPWHNKQKLIDSYINNSYDINAVAKKFDTSRKTIIQWLDRHGIEQKKPVINREDYPTEVPWRDKEVLEELYNEKDLSQMEISRLFDCSQSTIGKWMRKYDIKTRYGTKPSKDQLYELYIEEGLSTLKIATQLDANRGSVYRWLEAYDIPIRDSIRQDQLVEDLREEHWLRHHHVELEKTLSQIARELDCNPATVRKWALEHSIDIRPAGESIRGENHPHWKGGNKPYGKGWNNAKKEKVRERDDYLCQSCGMSNEEHLRLANKSLHIHHIIPARKFDDAEKRNNLENLVAFCQACHKEWEGIPLRPQFEKSD